MHVLYEGSHTIHAIVHADASTITRMHTYTVHEPSALRSFTQCLVLLVIKDLHMSEHDDSARCSQTLVTKQQSNYGTTKLTRHSTSTNGQCTTT
jgi:hypothetical protein